MQGRLYPEDINTLQTFPSSKWESEFFSGKEIGFDFLELLYDKSEDVNNPLTFPKGIYELNNISKLSGLPFYSLCIDYFTDNPLKADSNSAAWNKLIDIIEVARKLGIQVVIIPLMNKSSIDSKRELLRFLEAAEKKLENSFSQGLNICLETTIEAQTIYSAFKQIRTSFKLCYDFGNATALGYDTKSELHALKEYIAHIHIKDRKKSNGPNVQLMEGDVDFISCFNSLIEIGYEGNLTLETAMGKNPLESAKKNLLITKNFLSNS